MNTICQIEVQNDGGNTDYYDEGRQPAIIQSMKKACESMRAINENIPGNTHER
jgi:hypothetical protein